MGKKKILVLVLVCIILTAGYIILNPSSRYFSDFLAKSEQVKANILIVEGWLPDYAIEKAIDEFKKNGYELLLTTGLKSAPKYIKISMDGYLIFYPKNRFSSLTGTSQHIIEISAFSELEGNNCAHFNVFINDTCVSDFFAVKKRQKYLIQWEGELDKIDSIMVQFDNDEVGNYGDRNLYVKEVIIDRKIRIPYLNNSEYDITQLDGKMRIINNLYSNAEMTKRRILSTGIDSSRIVAIPGKRVNFNRTLFSAIAVRDWLKKSDLKIEGINIISLGTHARRTWMTYNKVLNKSFNVGIISLPDYKNNQTDKRRFIKTIRETIAIIYYWIILIPY